MGTPQYRREHVLAEILKDCGTYFAKVDRGEIGGEEEKVDNLDQHGPPAEDTGPPPEIDAEIVAVGALIADGVRIGLANERQSVADGERQLMDTEEPPIQRESAREILRGMRETQQRAAKEAIQQGGEEEMIEDQMMEQCPGLEDGQGSQNLGGELEEEVQRSELETRVVYQRREARTKKMYDLGREEKKTEREKEENRQREEEARKREEKQVEREKEEKRQREKEERQREDERSAEREQEKKRQREEGERKEEEKKVEREKEERRQREEEEQKRVEEKKTEREKEENRQREEEARKREEERVEREKEEKRQREKEERQREDERSAEREQEKKLFPRGNCS
ncbi:unnamed protein product [Closterium sp. Naga37s-1]|nr:unnamed protein product [Closterium sp. Naga37s-1]